MLRITARTRFFDFELRKELARRGRAGVEKAADYLRESVHNAMAWRVSASKPGQPPSARRDRAHGGALRNLVKYAWDEDVQKAIVGVLPLRGRKGPATVPRLHELGGTIPNDRLRARQVGAKGEVRILSKKQASRFRKSLNALKRATKATGEKRVPTSVGSARAVRVGPEKGDVVFVAYAKLKTARQAARATELNRQLYGKAAVYRYPKRSFLDATAKRIQPKLLAVFGKKALEGLPKSRKAG